MAEIPLTPKERQVLKGRAHGLDPVVLLGAQGLSEAVVKEIDRALTAHELIKVRVPGDEREQREALFVAVADRLGAARVQAIGKLLVFYRPKPERTRGRTDCIAFSQGARTASCGSQRDGQAAARQARARRPAPR